MQLAAVGSAYDVAQGAELLEAHLVQLAVIGRAGRRLIQQLPQQLRRQLARKKILH